MSISMVGCTYHGSTVTPQWLAIKVRNRIAYIERNFEFEPGKVLRKLEKDDLASQKIELLEADPENIVVTFSPVNKMSLVYIPAGDFLMGSDPSDDDHYYDEEPQHSVYLDSYWIAKTQTTNAQFAKCVDDGVCAYNVNLKLNPRYTDPAYANHPVVYVSWKMAQTYCVWSGGRLPSEAEWEKAARGPDGAKYAWGDEDPAENIFLVNAHNSITDTTPVGLFHKGASYYGVMDMGGNVREWVADWYDPAYYANSPHDNPRGPVSGEKKVLKGASYLDPYDYTRAANRLEHKPSSPGATRGFRCVYSHAMTQTVHFIFKN